MCVPGAVVVEITGELMPRLWANFAIAIGLSYFAYVAEIYPRSIWAFHRIGPDSRVTVNATNLAAFAADALDISGFGLPRATTVRDTSSSPTRY